ncbi:MAG: hypothetical protein JWR69_2600, partial [Pedosphaera sp.]|nr:hypothetical protein [Pedosphaera sp.]
FRDVTTYVQSGNVVFKGATKSPTLITKRIEEKISSEFGFAVPVLLRTAEELGDIVKGNAFVKDAAVDLAKLHVTFLSAVAPKTAAQRLEGLVVKPERFGISGREIYLYCPNGYGNTKLSNTAIEKKLGAGATTRNWKSVNALLALANRSEPL